MVGQEKLEQQIDIYVKAIERLCALEGWDVVNEKLGPNRVVVIKGIETD